jgi:hypothetical protein
MASGLVAGCDWVALCRVTLAQLACYVHDSSVPVPALQGLPGVAGLVVVMSGVVVRSTFSRHSTLPLIRTSVRSCTDRRCAMPLRCKGAAHDERAVDLPGRG